MDVAIWVFWSATLLLSATQHFRYNVTENSANTQSYAQNLTTLYIFINSQRGRRLEGVLAACHAHAWWRCCTDVFTQVFLPVRSASAFFCCIVFAFKFHMIPVLLYAEKASPKSFLLQFGNDVDINTLCRISPLWNRSYGLSGRPGSLICYHKEAIRNWWASSSDLLLNILFCQPCIASTLLHLWEICKKLYLQKVLLPQFYKRIILQAHKIVVLNKDTQISQLESNLSVLLQCFLDLYVPAQGGQYQELLSLFQQSNLSCDVTKCFDGTIHRRSPQQPRWECRTMRLHHLSSGPQRASQFQMFGFYRRVLLTSSQYGARRLQMVLTLWAVSGYDLHEAWKWRQNRMSRESPLNHRNLHAWFVKEAGGSGVLVAVGGDVWISQNRSCCQKESGHNGVGIVEAVAWVTAHVV